MVRQAVPHDKCYGAVIHDMRPRVDSRIDLAGSICRGQHTDTFCSVEIAFELHNDLLEVIL